MIKSFLWVGLLVFGLQGAWAFSLGGPIGNNPKPSGGAGIKGDAWQQPVIGYGLAGDINAPKNIGEEYRPNIPVMYYACDANFLGFFGSNGVSAVDQAFDILNSAFTNNPTGLTNGLDGYSSDLSEFPLESRHLNYEAQAMGLFDLKSWTLGVMMEQLGLADPVRYDWTLHDRLHESGAGIPPCPGGMEYLVVQRNFDFVTTPLNQLQYSPYINDTLYSYYVVEFCTGPNPLATTYFPDLGTPFSVDPLADTYSPVASWVSGTVGYGIFYTGLTRDDMAGLRYLLTANNINYENGPAGSVQLNSNSGGGPGGLGPPFPLYTSNYTAFASAALTNDPVTLATLFPGLVVSSSTLSWVAVATPNIVVYLTNQVGAPLGAPPVLVVKTNGFTTNAMANYADIFANLIIITNSYHTNTSAKLVTVTVTTPQGAPLGSPLVTNTSVKNITLTNVPSGLYYIDTNYTCGPTVILSPQPSGFPIANVVATTNLIYAASNSAGYFTSQSIVIYATNYVFIAQAPVCATVTTSTGVVASATGLYEGIEKMQFINAPFDSLIGQTFQPITNTFTAVFIAGSKTVTNKFQRVVTTPDFTFSAADIAAGPQDPQPPNPYVSSLDRGISFDQGNALNGLAGPGLINPPSTITFDKVGPVYFNYSGLMDGTPYFTESPGNDFNDLYYGLYFTWASFDGTTNDPVVYPDGMSIENLENEIVVQITPTSLPNGTNGTAYPPVTFTATGGAFSYSPTPPTWTVLAPGLPPGLTISTDGTLSGTPTQSGTFDFILKMTDSLSRSVQWFYSVTIQ